MLKGPKIFRNLRDSFFILLNKLKNNSNNNIGFR